MKRSILVIALISMVLLMSFSCGGEQNIVGTWELNIYEIEGLPTTDIPPGLDDFKLIWYFRNDGAFEVRALMPLGEYETFGDKIKFNPSFLDSVLDQRDMEEIEREIDKVDVTYRIEGNELFVTLDKEDESETITLKFTRSKGW